MHERLAHDMERLVQCASASRSARIARAQPETEKALDFFFGSWSSRSTAPRSVQLALEALVRDRSVSAATLEVKS